MRVTIDSTAKTIKVETDIKLGELMDFLGTIFPEKVWKEYTLETHSVVHYNYPFVWEPYKTPWKYNNVWCNTNGSSVTYSTDNLGCKM